ncbi:MAG TPA: sulfotransferase [Longimicrobiaceae bacterium]
MVIYIAGYGRSGSTILSIILGAHPEIASVGEIAFAHEDWFDPNRACSCLRPYPECEFWSDFLPLAHPQATRSARLTERVLALPLLWLGLLPGSRRSAYQAFQANLLAGIRRKTAKPIIVDASKSARLTAARPLALARLLDEDVFVIHMVRDGRATVRSLVRTGSNWALEGRVPPLKAPVLRAVLGWVLTNLWTSTLRWALGRDRYIRLRYEDFVAEPGATLRRLGNFLGVNLEPVVERLQAGETFSAEHMVGGNRVRFETQIALRPNAVAAKDTALAGRERQLFALLGAWLNRRYGYAD